MQSEMKPFARVPRLGVCLPPLSSGDPMEPVDPGRSRAGMNIAGEGGWPPVLGSSIQVSIRGYRRSERRPIGQEAGGGPWEGGVWPRHTDFAASAPVTVMQESAKAAADAAAESSALMRIHRPG